MQPEPRDDLERALIERALKDLYLKELPQLKDQSCRNLLGVMMSDRWMDLVAASLSQRKSTEPNDGDALRAFDALKDAFFEKDPHLLNLSLPDLWRRLKCVSLRSWLVIVPVAISAVTAITGVAFWLGAHFGK